MADEANPFVRYRRRLDSYRRARQAGWSDAEFVDLVRRLDAAVAEIEADVGGHGFTITPAGFQPALAAALDLTQALIVKDDTRNVGGSHKARHLFGVALHHAVSGRDGGELAIASCGNAAVAAAVTARAVGRPLRVFIPTWADPAVVHLLERLGATISVEDRRPGEQGDPTYLRFLEAVAAGAIPFSVQGTVTPETLDGGRTMGWELADQLADLGVAGTVRLFVQIGGGALAASTWRGLIEGLAENGAAILPALHAVQTEACAPLPRAWDRLTARVSKAPWPERAARLASAPDVAAELETEMAAHPDEYMWPWEPVGTSAATGILDDVTYDWQPVVSAMLRSGGWPVVASEDDVARAHEAAHATTEIDVDPTGTAGLAGTLDPSTRHAMSPTDTVAALFTGVTR